ncbi:MAG: hypothetical protein GY714_18015 [Desulfobacterales bacterium]|nr:hypothetical protein [Desulfobacterales bacterium]
MAYINLSDQSNELPGRRYQETLSAGTNGTWLILDTMGKDDTLTVSLSITSGTGSIEFTNEDIDSVKNDTATGKTWPDGTVNETKYRCAASTITAVRPVRATGTIKFSASL